MMQNEENPNNLCIAIRPFSHQVHIRFHERIALVCIVLLKLEDDELGSIEITQTLWLSLG